MAITMMNGPLDQCRDAALAFSAVPLFENSNDIRARRPLSLPLHVNRVIRSLPQHRLIRIDRLISLWPLGRYSKQTVMWYRLAELPSTSRLESSKDIVMCEELGTWVRTLLLTIRKIECRSHRLDGRDVARSKTWDRRRLCTIVYTPPPSQLECRHKPAFASETYQRSRGRFSQDLC